MKEWIMKRGKVYKLKFGEIRVYTYDTFDKCWVAINNESTVRLIRKYGKWEDNGFWEVRIRNADQFYTLWDKKVKNIHNFRALILHNNLQDYVNGNVPIRKCYV